MAGVVRKLLGVALRHAPEPSSVDREEKGFPHAESETMSRSGRGGRTNTIISIDPSDLIPSQDRLLTFRTLTGIDTVPAINRAGYSARTASNIGLYTRVIREERRAKKSYRFISLLIHVCLGLQIVIGAAITAVAASNGSHTAITGLGAINTIFAGALAYVKGSGYPESLKHHELAWKKIREYIEQRERELCLAGSGLDVHHEVRIVEHMYERTKMELKFGRSGRGGRDDKRMEAEDASVSVPRRKSSDIRPAQDSSTITSTMTPAATHTGHEQRPDSTAGNLVIEKHREN